MVGIIKMKNYTQVYVKNSYEAAKTYCKAFGAEITREFKNETFYDNPDIADNCGFVTCYKGEPIGFISWDPRNRPDYVEM